MSNKMDPFHNAHNQAAGGYLGQGEQYSQDSKLLQALQNVAVGASRELSTIERIKKLFVRHNSVRKQQDAYDEVLSYFEAQINIEPFKANKLADLIFQKAMAAAIESIAQGS